jgi:hypothetical protein
MRAVIALGPIVVGHVGCLLLGAVVGLAAVAVHREAPPWGLLLAMATTFAVPARLLASPRVAIRRTGASYVAGWLVVGAVVLPGRPEGDYALASDLEGFVLLGAGFLLVVVGVVSVTGGRRRRP